jgi:exosortase
MTISENRSIFVPRRVRQEWPEATTTLFPACLLALGFFPLAVLQARSLWDRPHCRAFPFAVVGGLVLARLSTRSLGLLRPGPGRLTLAGLGLCWALLAVAVLSAWPWLGMLSAMATLLVLTLGLGGWKLLRAVMAAWAFVSLAVLLPSGADLLLVSRLQSVVTRWGSPLLDALGVFHVTEGNVIQIGSRRLLVEEACSGIHSLFAVLGCTLFFVLYTRRAWPRAVFLVASAFAWVVLGNVARVVTVALAQARWGLDLSHGWPHEALGLVILVAVLALTVSTDRLLQFISALTAVRWSEPIILTQRQAPSPPPEVEQRLPTELPDARRTWLGSRPLGAAFGVLGIAQVIWLWPPLADAFSADPVVAKLKDLGENDLPARLGSFQRQESHTTTRDSGDPLGEFSRNWTYKSGRGTVSVSVDYPFRGWHELTNCYQNVGWGLKSRVERPGDGPGGTGVFVEATFDKPSGRHALLCFGLDESDGQELEPRPSRSLLSYLGNRLNLAPRGEGKPGGRRAVSRYVSRPPCYQVQVMIESISPLLPSDREEVRAAFNQFRQILRRRVAQQVGANGKGGAS